MQVEGRADRRFEAVGEAFGARAEAVENAFRACLGMPPLDE